MSGLPPGVRRLFRVRSTGSEGAQHEVEAEIRVHVQMRIEQLVGEGWTQDAAEAEARRLFSADGGAIRDLHRAARERDRSMRLRERLESWAQDGRYAVRSLGRDPLLTGFVVATLALGLGLNAAAFSLLDRLLLRDPEHVVEPDRLARLYATVVSPSIGEETMPWMPVPVYEEVRDGLRGFSAVGAYRVQERVAGVREGARRLRVGQVMGAFFPVLGTQPLRGRLFGESEDAAAAGPLAVIGAEYWESVLGADPDVLGRSITIEDTDHTIVGIAPRGFAGTELRSVDVWILADSRSAGTMNWWIIGRLRPGVTQESATSELKALHERTRDRSPTWFRDADLFAASIRKDASGREPFEATLSRWLTGVAAVILLVAVANVVSLLLARLARRQRELALRIALGSGRARVIRLISLEGTLLVAAGGLVSLWIVRVSEPVLRRALLGDEAAWTFTLLDLRLLGALAALVILTAAIVSLAPAMQAGRRTIESALRAGAQGGGSGNPRVRAVLTVVQATMSVTLLVGAGLFIRSLARINAIDLGVDRDQLITATAELPRPTDFSREGFARYEALESDIYRRLADAVPRLTGIERAAVAIGRPLDGGTFSAAVYVNADSVVTLPSSGPWAAVVGPGYFETAGTGLISGRTFTDLDRAGSEQVLVVGRTMADRLWPGSDPIDACVRLNRPDAPCYRVVGVVEDVHRVGLREPPSLQYYIPIGQQSMFGGATLLIRTSPARSVSWPELRQAILDVDPAIRFVDLQWLEQSVDAEMRPIRLGMLTFGLSGGLALLVAVLGLYSLMSYMVAWRTREIGVRMAIGATRPQITRLVIGGGAGLAAIGVALGLMLSFWASRWVQPHLFETSGVDPVVFGGVAGILPAVAVLAGLVPALRALAISPVEALRAE